jgi:large subunit ribosomal protein L15
MDLSNLKPAAGATHKTKRIGRGEGSGRGGHSSTRGTKGQKSVSGASIPVWFEGGQMPLQRRLPKFGFKNPFRVEYHTVNVGRLAELVEAKQMEAGADVTPETMVELGLVRKADRVKVLGGGELNVALNITADKFSASAREKITAAGGTATERKQAH